MAIENNESGGSIADPPGSGNMRTGVVTIPSKPIESGVYGWGWVSYNRAQNPDKISVVIFEDVINRRTAEKIHRFMMRPSILNWLLTYLPLIIMFALSFFKIESGLLFAALIGLTAWNVLQRHMIQRKSYRLIECDRNVENYIVGKEFLRALTHRGLITDSPYAYFNLRVSADDLDRTIDGYIQKP